MALLAILDTETSGMRFTTDSLLQVSIQLMDTDGVNVDALGHLTMSNINERDLTFESIAPVNKKEFQSDALRANRIGLSDQDKAKDIMALKYTDVDYAWDWILKNHTQTPRDVFNTISREVTSYSTGGRTFNPVLDEGSDIVAKPVYFVAANPSFDYPFMSRYFQGLGIADPFFYAPIDIKAYFAQAMKVPFAKTKMWQMSKAVGGNLSGTTGAHTAKADAVALKEVVLYLLKHGVSFD